MYFKSSEIKLHNSKTRLYNQLIDKPFSFILSYSIHNPNNNLLKEIVKLII